MKRVLAITLAVLLAGAALLEAQTTGINDRELGRLPIPGTNTTGYRVHGTGTTLNVSIPGGFIDAATGFRTTTHFAHGGRIVAGSTQTATPLMGSVGDSPVITAGVFYSPAARAGSIRGVSIASSTALTANAAHAEATIIDTAGTVRGSGLRAVIGFGLTATQYGTATATKSAAHQYSAGEAVGCRLTIDSGITPLSAELVCSVVWED